MDRLSYFILLIGISPSVDDDYIKTNLEALPSVEHVIFAKEYIEDSRIGNIVYVSIIENMHDDFIREVNTPELYTSFGSFFYLKLMGIMKPEDIGKIILCQSLPSNCDMEAVTSMFSIYEGLECVAPVDDGTNSSYIIQYNNALSGWQSYLDFNNKLIFSGSVDPVHIEIYNEYNNDFMPSHNTSLFSRVNNPLEKESQYPSFRKLTLSSEFQFSQQNSFPFVRSRSDYIRSSNQPEFLPPYQPQYDYYPPERKMNPIPPQYCYQYPSSSQSPQMRYPLYPHEDNYSEYDSVDTIHTYNSGFNSIYDEQSPQEYSYSSFSSRDSSYYAPGVIPPYLSFGPRGVGIAPKYEGPPGGNLFVYNIPKSFQDIDLLRIFQPYGNILSAKVFIDKQNGKPKGFGFVSYVNAKMAQTAIVRMNGAMVEGRKLKVQLKRKDVEKYMSS